MKILAYVRTAALTAGCGLLLELLALLVGNSSAWALEGRVEEPGQSRVIIWRSKEAMEEGLSLLRAQMDQRAKARAPRGMRRQKRNPRRVDRPE